MLELDHIFFINQALRILEIGNVIFSNPPKNFHTRKKRNTPAEEISNKTYLAEKQRIWQLEENFAKSLLRIKGTNEIWRSIAFSLCCIMFSRFPAKCETLPFQQQLHVATNKNFRKVLDCWSLVWTFCPSIANLFGLQVKRICLKLHRTRKSTKK